MTEQREFWERRAEIWDQRAAAMEAVADSFGRAAIEALALAPGERVLDIGCGPGVTALQLAEVVGPAGEVVGVDISEGMVAGATRRAGDVARFVVADAQVEPLGSGFDAAFSRFGVMFFPDPAAAFANIAAALRPGGRFAAAVWAELEGNHWMFVPTLAALGPLGATIDLPGPDEPGPFSLADEARTVPLLEGAGFADVGIERLEGVQPIGEATADADVRVLLGSGPVAEAFQAADHASQQAAVAAVLAAIEPYRTATGWELPRAALVIRATRP